MSLCIFLLISDEEYSTSTNKPSTRTSKYETVGVSHDTPITIKAEAKP